MIVKGSEVKAAWDWFWNKGNNINDYYFEDNDAFVQIQDDHGHFCIEEDKEYDTLDFGYFGWQGDGHHDPSGYVEFNFLHMIKLYRTEMDSCKFEVVTIRLPKEEINSLKDIISSHENWKIL